MSNMTLNDRAMVKWAAIRWAHDRPLDMRCAKIAKTSGSTANLGRADSEDAARATAADHPFEIPLESIHGAPMLIVLPMNSRC